MGWVAGIALLMGSQDPVEMQVDSLLREYEAAAQAEQSGFRLVEQLLALGDSAVEPLAQRLAEDLRDGMVSDSADGILEAISGRSDAQVPLQTAFADGTTPPAGRIELARALSDLLDHVSWRDGLLAVAADPEVELSDRRRAAELLLEEGDERVLDVLSEIDALEGMDLLDEMREAEERLRRWREEPRVTVEGEVRPLPPERRPPPGKKEDGAGAASRYYVTLGAAAAGVAALLLVFRRKD